MKIFFLTLFTLLTLTNLKSQTIDNESIKKSKLDSLYIQEVEVKQEPIKVLHAEPLYIDLIRDLGA